MPHRLCGGKLSLNKDMARLAVESDRCSNLREPRMRLPLLIRAGSLGSASEILPEKRIFIAFVIFPYGCERLDSQSGQNKMPGQDTFPSLSGLLRPRLFQRKSPLIPFRWRQRGLSAWGVLSGVVRGPFLRAFASLPGWGVLLRCVSPRCSSQVLDVPQAYSLMPRKRSISCWARAAPGRLTPTSWPNSRASRRSLCISCTRASGPLV